ncbi:MAG: methyltransferase domain-containing protein [Planctomycetota bacterium]
MREEHLRYLVCPRCQGDLEILDGRAAGSPSIETGSLKCTTCRKTYEIVRHVPRFVPAKNYAGTFGLEWTRHARTQYDGHTGANISETRFFEETKWPRRLEGQLVLEVGSGSGRFTEQAASTGAMVASVDYSSAVDANYASNGGRENVLIVQADLRRMPFRENFFDRLFCFGVLQHTPDPERSFMALPRYLKSGGSLVVDVYRRRGAVRQALATKYWARLFTRRMAPERLYRWCEAYIRFMWPVARLLRRLPLGRGLTWKLLIADYYGVRDLREEMLIEWAILDTFDMLSPMYDNPQTVETVREWFRKADMSDIDVRCGYNGVEGRGTKNG